MAYQLYVGSRWDRETTNGLLLKILQKRHEGFSFMPMTGCYKGLLEESWLIIIEDDLAKIILSMSDLRKALEQEVIGWQKVPTINF